jgi:CAAX prenyl protease-like protein
MLAGSLEPKPPPQAAAGWPAIPYQYYPVVYTLKISLTLGAILLVLPGYRGFSFRVRPLPVLVGAAGIVVWVGLCELKLEARWLGPLGLGRLVDLGARSGYNPTEAVTPEDWPWAWTFLAVRLFGLVLVVPVIEEFFLRGFLMRFFVRRDWWEVPFGTVNAAALAAGLAYPVLSHPGEMLAAAAWFSLVTLLMIKTRNLWDCVVAHAVTNLLLGLYVVHSGQWHLM